MLPFKHYSGPEIEEVLFAFEEGATVNSVATGAEESTLQRWKKQFHSLIPILSEQLEALASKFFLKETSLSRIPDRPLRRLKRALGLVEEPDLDWTLLGRSFVWAQAHPLCIG
jgi:erythromycin esterase-like protein